MTEKDESTGATGAAPADRSKVPQVLLHWALAVVGLTVLIGGAALLIN